MSGGGSLIFMRLNRNYFVNCFFISFHFLSHLSTMKWLMKHASTLEKISIFPLIGKKLAVQRKSLKLTQTQLAELIGVEPETISRIESGAVAPSIERLASYAQALGIGLEELFSDVPLTPYDTQKEWVSLMGQLSPADRSFVLSMVRTWVQRLK